MSLRVFSTFSGIGGFEVGISNAAVGRSNVEVIGYSEIDKPATSVYEKHFKGVRNYGDITKINADKLADFDCLVGGFPCQAFSVAGRRRGFEDTRGTLFFDLARILRAKQPKLFVFENVKGLLNHDGGRTFATIIQTIDELGYDCQWQVLNSKDFGVPQNRERIIVVGHLRGTPRPEVFPINGTDQKNIVGDKKRDANIFPTIRATHYKSGDNQPLIKVKEATKKGYAEATVGDSINLAQPNSKTRRGRVGRGVANTIDTGMHQYTIQPVQTPDRFNKKQNGRQIKPDGEPSHTLTAADRHGVLLSKTVRAGGRGSPHGSKQNWDSYEVGGVIRRLTPLECERLQAFPDNWTKYAESGEEVSDTQRYKMCGNAVTTTVIQAVFERIFSSGVLAK